MPPSVAPSPHGEEMLAAFARLEETLGRVRRDAGAGCAHTYQRDLHAHLRSLRALLPGDAARLAEDVVDAATRVLESAEPEAPLHALQLAVASLGALIRRQAVASPLLPQAA